MTVLQQYSMQTNPKWEWKVKICVCSWISLTANSAFNSLKSCSISSNHSKFSAFFMEFTQLVNVTKISCKSQKWGHLSTASWVWQILYISYIFVQHLDPFMVYLACALGIWFKLGIFLFPWVESWFLPWHELVLFFSKCTRVSMEYTRMSSRYNNR